jgi:acetylornithine deacetylase/succinyl-diaminopimelate desuccinylase-like protein
MKATTIGQLEAIRQLKQEGFQPLRNVHISILPGTLLSFL